MEHVEQPPDLVRIFVTAERGTVERTAIFVSFGTYATL